MARLISTEAYITSDPHHLLPSGQTSIETQCFGELLGAIHVFKIRFNFDLFLQKFLGNYVKLAVTFFDCSSGLGGDSSR